MTNYVTEQLHLNGVDITMLYPTEFYDNDNALVGVVQPPLDNEYPFKVRVSKIRGERRYLVVLLERAENLTSYNALEKYRCWTKAGAVRKAKRLIRRGINMGGVK